MGVWLQPDADDLDTRVLAVAIGAATMAQLKLDRFKDTDITDDATASSLEAEYQRLREVLKSRHVTLNTIRTAFFLHIYHENQQPGGVKSLLYLRKAIALAQIMGLHRLSSYLGLDPAEDRLRRRMLWLLFVTERGVATLHKLPIILRPAEKLPPLYGSRSSDEANVPLSRNSSIYPGFSTNLEPSTLSRLPPIRKNQVWRTPS